ncbi:hypothetical protein [Quisquiliibacterium transsilvanicum]|uniref:HEPN domain-containing protein n=1 Tax=Quisquiliibacterium transsilvanicum TaxID=1549638 RepID=A0A7W8M859_9BURK|nr:hypothetical protein [Quisquiliibacterium transsilvanicum]MBB5271287.1 hypothetical protein [Quisquiliibacterium transsilvanicum]
MERGVFKLRAHDEPLGFESNHGRYFRYAIQLLPALETKCREVLDAWPVPRDEPVRDAAEKFPDLHAMVDERDRLSDSVRVYASMAAEGFLNWYGVLRLTEAIFNENFERLALVPKAKTLLLVCDNLIIAGDDPLILALNRVAQSRNALVHPKAREISDIAAGTPRPHSRVPDTARSAVSDMEAFFAEFVAAVPDARTLVPRRRVGA